MAFQRKKPAAVGVRAPFPGFIEPALATSAEKVPSGQLSVVHQAEAQNVPPGGLDRPARLAFGETCAAHIGPPKK